VRIGARWTFLPLLFFASSVAMAADPAPVPLHRILLSQAPKQVQRNLIEYFAGCDIPARITRSAARLDVGPIGGPGRKDYYFGFLGDYWKAPASALDHLGQGCMPNHYWSLIWMNVGSGRYEELEEDNVSIYIKQLQILIVNPAHHCDLKTWSRARAWWDCVRFQTWDARSAKFRPLTPDMTLDDADAWAKAHGYAAYGQ
jgi:hypothetical protein